MAGKAFNLLTEVNKKESVDRSDSLVIFLYYFRVHDLRNWRGSYRVDYLLVYYRGGTKYRHGLSSSILPLGLGSFQLPAGT
jgi:hypothetical protein